MRAVQRKLLKIESKADLYLARGKSAARKTARQDVTPILLPWQMEISLHISEKNTIDLIGIDIYPIEEIECFHDRLHAVTVTK
jgi:hypothetical protein